jgi:hypothetical protein
MAMLKEEQAAREEASEETSSPSWDVKVTSQSSYPRQTHLSFVRPSQIWHLMTHKMNLTSDVLEESKGLNIVSDASSSKIDG